MKVGNNAPIFQTKTFRPRKAHLKKYIVFYSKAEGRQDISHFYCTYPTLPLCLYLSSLWMLRKQRTMIFPHVFCAHWNNQWVNSVCCVGEKKDRLIGTYSFLIPYLNVLCSSVMWKHVILVFTNVWYVFLYYFLRMSI